MAAENVAAQEAPIVYADTNALYSLLDAADARHDEAATIFRSLLGDGAVLATSSYVVAELTALVQSRLGLDAALRVHRTLLPVLDVVFVDRALHERAVAAWAAARRWGLSLVDCAGFELMRDLGMVTALAFDRHFEETGLHSVLVEYLPGTSAQVRTELDVFADGLETFAAAAQPRTSNPSSRITARQASTTAGS